MVTKVSGAMIADSAVAHDNMADNSVGHDEMRDNSVGNDEMRDDAVNTNELVNGAVTAGKLASTLDLSAKTLTLSAAQKAEDYIEIRDEKAANTAGGGFTSGAWRTRDLNTESSDAGNNASLSSNQITLAAGTYVCDIICPAAFCNAHKALLYNVTDSADILIGTSEWSGTGATIQTSSHITGRFTIGASKALEVRHRCGTTRNTDGFGIASNLDGKTEVYTVARFWKVG